MAAMSRCDRNLRFLHSLSGPEKGSLRKGSFHWRNLESLNLKSLNSPESLENGRILLSFPQSGGSLKSLESLENGLF